MFVRKHTNLYIRVFNPWFQSKVAKSDDFYKSCWCGIAVSQMFSTQYSDAVCLIRFLLMLVFFSFGQPTFEKILQDDLCNEGCSLIVFVCVVILEIFLVDCHSLEGFKVVEWVRGSWHDGAQEGGSGSGLADYQHFCQILMTWTIICFQSFTYWNIVTKCIINVYR